MHVVLAPAVYTALQRHARAGLPAEACGLLARRPGGAAIELVRFAPQPNLAAAPDRFAIDPLATLRLADRWRAAGLALGGVFHSHPAGPATPSTADQAAAAGWPELLQLILAPAAGPAGPAGQHRCTAWRWHRGQRRLVPVPWTLRGDGAR